MTDQYAVIGNPIEHSKSPLIHRQFAEETGQDIEYGKLFSKIDAFSATASKFLSEGGKGLNVTVPFKLDAMNFADALSERAQLAEAVNTLIKDADGKVTGDNTDGVGFVRDVTQNLRTSLANRRILVLGAGGAVRGILPIIANENPTCIHIANRTASKAEALAIKMSTMTTAIGFGLDALINKHYDVIINGSSAGLTSELPDLPVSLLDECQLAYDLVYANEDTQFVSWAKQSDQCRTANGLGMLVEQAAESFYLWRNIRPDTRTIIESLR